MNDTTKTIIGFAIGVGMAVGIGIAKESLRRKIEKAKSDQAIVDEVETEESE